MKIGFFYEEQNKELSFSEECGGYDEFFPYHM
jgi:hypothetical protein